MFGKLIWHVLAYCLRPFHYICAYNSLMANTRHFHRLTPQSKGCSLTLTGWVYGKRGGILCICVRVAHNSYLSMYYAFYNIYMYIRFVMHSKLLASSRGLYLISFWQPLSAYSSWPSSSGHGTLIALLCRNFYWFLLCGLQLLIPFCIILIWKIRETSFVIGYSV